MSTLDVVGLCLSIVIAALWAGSMVFKRELRKLRELERATRGVQRRIVKLEDIPGGKLATLECGHQFTIGIVFPETAKCNRCTREVEDLEQISKARGEK